MSFSTGVVQIDIGTTGSFGVPVMYNQTSSVLAGAFEDNISIIQTYLFNYGTPPTIPNSPTLAQVQTALGALRDMAVNGQVLPLNPSDPNSITQKYYLTGEMAESLDVLYKTLSLVGVTISSTAGVPVSITQNQASMWQNIAAASPLVQNAISAALSAVQDNGSLQSMIELVYIKTANQVLGAQLGKLETALETTKNTLNILINVQDLKNQLTIQGKGSFSSVTGFSFSSTYGGQDRYVSAYHTAASAYFGTPISPTVTGVVPLANAIGPNTYGLDPSFMAVFGSRASGTTPASGLAAVIAGGTTVAQNYALSANFFYGHSVGSLYTADILNPDGSVLRSIKGQYEALPGIPGNLLSYNNPADKATIDSLHLVQVHLVGEMFGSFDYPLPQGTYDTTIWMQDPLYNPSGDYQGLPNALNKAITLYNMLSPPPSGSIVQLGSGFQGIQFVDGAAATANIPNLSTVIVPPPGGTVTTPLSQISANTNTIGFVPARGSIPAHFQFSPLTAGALAARDKLMQEVKQLVQYRNALSTQLHLLSAITPPSPGISGRDPNSLAGRLSSVLSDIKSVFVTSNGQPVLATTSFDSAYAGFSKWMLDNYNSQNTSSSGGTFQQDITNAITAGQSLNSTQQESVRQYLYIFEQYYKSASAILQQITQIIERVAQGIAR